MSCFIDSLGPKDKEYKEQTYVKMPNIKKTRFCESCLSDYPNVVRHMGYCPYYNRLLLSEDWRNKHSVVIDTDTGLVLC